jgi:2,5-diketo-D-gluconate reductase B
MHMLQIKGQSVPALGFGTWPLKGAECRQGVEHALAIGYRHIDTAQGYENEDAVGEAMQRSGIPRDEIFLVTKVRTQNFTYDKTIASTHESLRKLRTDYIDLLLLHWPNPQVPLEETLRAMRRLQEEGSIRHIGVSNFSPQLVEEAASQATIFCNQVEHHPYLAQKALIAQAKEMDYLFTAYSPLARGKVLGDATLQAIAAAHGKTVAQVIFRWQIQQGLATIPKAGSDQHRQENFDIFDFELTPDEMGQIDALGAQGYSVHS